MASSIKFSKKKVYIDCRYLDFVRYKGKQSRCEFNVHVSSLGQKKIYMSSVIHRFPFNTIYLTSQRGVYLSGNSMLASKSISSASLVCKLSYPEGDETDSHGLGSVMKSSTWS